MIAAGRCALPTTCSTPRSAGVREARDDQEADGRRDRRQAHPRRRPRVQARPGPGALQGPAPPPPPGTGARGATAGAGRDGGGGVAARLRAEMLHSAVHGSTWGRAETPRQVWLDLLAEVQRMRALLGGLT